MNILVVGGAGYIGSHTVRELIDEGHNVVVFDSLVKGHVESLPFNVKFVKGNLNNFSSINKVFVENKIDAVMHFAAYSLVGESMDDPLKYYKNNLNGGMNLIKAMLGNGVKKIVFSSTAAAYGEPSEMPITEEFKLSPTNHYGKSKIMFESILDSCEVYGLKSVCLRYFNAAGAGYGIGEDHDPESHLIPIVLQVALGKRDCIKIFGNDYDTPDGTCVRDYIHVVDLAKAHVLALKKLEGGSAKYNLGCGKGFSVREVIDVAREVTGHPIPVEEVSRRVGDPAVLIASSEKISKELGWVPLFGLKEIVKSAWEWHSKNPNGF